MKDYSAEGEVYQTGPRKKPYRPEGWVNTMVRYYFLLIILPRKVI